MSRRRSNSQAGRMIWGLSCAEAALRSKTQKMPRRLWIERGKSRDPESSLREILMRAGDQGVEVSPCDKSKLDGLSDGGIHQGVVVECAPYTFRDEYDLEQQLPEEGPCLIVALDQIQDPHNFGAIVRSAYALGAQAVLVPERRSAPPSGVAARASAGATELIAMYSCTNLATTLDKIKQDEIWVVGLEMEGSQPISKVDLGGRVCLVAGNEGTGLRRLVAESCDVLAHIPMAGSFESLNVSVATAIAIYELQRARN